MTKKERTAKVNEIAKVYKQAILDGNWDYPNLTPFESQEQLYSLILQGKTSQAFMLQAMADFGDIHTALSAIGGYASRKVEQCIKHAIMWYVLPEQSN